MYKEKSRPLSEIVRDAKSLLEELRPFVAQLEGLDSVLRVVVGRIHSVEASIKQLTISSARNPALMSLLPRLLEEFGQSERLASFPAIPPTTGSPQEGKSIEEGEWSVRTYNCLKNANIRTFGELVSKSEKDILATKNFGKKSMKEIAVVLAGMGLALRS